MDYLSSVFVLVVRLMFWIQPDTALADVFFSSAAKV